MKDFPARLNTIVVLLLCTPCVLFSQRLEFEELDFNRTEAWAMKYFGSASLLSGYGPLLPRESGWVDLGLEILQIPFLGEEYRRVGFRGIKVEHLNNAPVLMRPRISYYLRDKISLIVSYLPPIELWDVKAHLFSGSLNVALWQKDSWQLGLRAYLRAGRFRKGSVYLLSRECHGRQ